MLRKKKVIWKTCLLVIGALLVFYLVGCDHRGANEEVNEAGNEKLKAEEKEGGEIVEICRESYTKAEKEGKLDDLDMIRELLDKLGENGYTAVDSENQMNMTEHEKLLQFCEAVEAKKRSLMTIVELAEKGSCIIRKMETENGDVKIVRNYYVYRDGKMELSSKDTYKAESWEYTEDGYLMFSGWLTLKDSYEITRDKMMEYTAYRVLPLDETCRELNRKYVLPVGYACNNMFLENWSEEDFGELDFYDLFDVFHPQPVNESAYYTLDNGMKTCAVYMIPKEEFEQTIMSKFQISSEILQSKTVYHPEEKRYEYKPRGLEEVEYPEYPYPEVTEYKKNANGTLTLKVNAVFPYRGISKAYTHEVTVRDTSGGEIQYVANRIVEPMKDQDIAWHKPRLTRAEWEAQYGENGQKIEASKTMKESSKEGSIESTYWFLPQSGECLISDKEKEELQSMALSAAESVREVYKDMEIIENTGYSSGIASFTCEQRKKVVEQLGKGGFVAVEKDTNMTNPEEIEEFYEKYVNGQDSTVTVFEVQQDGLIGVVTFIYREEKLQTYYIGIQWKEYGIPEIQGTLASDVAEIKLTEKGYFIYAYENTIAHESLRQYWRIKPLSEECRKLTKKYISGLSYVNYNILITNWNSKNVEAVLMPCMYGDIYRIATGKNLQVKNGQIPAEEYEKIMTTYLPVSVEQLQKHCGYDTNSNSYAYEMIYASPYPPFGEVVDYRMHSDGKITLIVDGVWPDYNLDIAFQNVIVVQPFEDGTFKYLSNSVEQKELELPTLAEIERRENYVLHL